MVYLFYFIIIIIIKKKKKKKKKLYIVGKKFFSPSPWPKCAQRNRISILFGPRDLEPTRDSLEKFSVAPDIEVQVHQDVGALDISSAETPKLPEQFRNSKSAARAERATPPTFGFRKLG